MPSSEFFSAAVGALLGLSTGLTVEWWKDGRSSRAKLCDGFCAIIGEAANVAVDYYLSASDSDRSKAMEAQLYGFQRRISGYNVLVTGRLHDAGLDDIQEQLATLFRTLTGGDFGDPDRTPNYGAAIAVQDAAAAAIVAIRKADYETSSFRESFYRLISVGQ